jgi:hypothetical protein
MTTNVKTELASVEEHDNAVWKAIERRAYALYELDGFKDGQRPGSLVSGREGANDPTDLDCSIEDDAITVRMTDFPSGGQPASSLLSGSRMIRAGSGGNNRPHQHFGSQCTDILP